VARSLIWDAKGEGLASSNPIGLTYLAEAEVRVEGETDLGADFTTFVEPMNF